MDYLLEKRRDDKKPIKIQLFSNEITLGSGYIETLQNYSKVSKLHGRLQKLNGSWYIEDLGSTHGVFLNREQIGRIPKKVEYWDVIGLGGHYISNDAFICVLLPCDKSTAEGKNIKSTPLKDKPSSKTDLSEKTGAICSSYHVPLKRSQSAQHAGSESKMELNERNRSKVSSEVKEALPTYLSTPSDINWKIDSFLKSMDNNSEQSCNLYTETEHVKDLQDDDVKSTTSSVESMNIIMYPSESALSKIQKIKMEEVKKPTDVKNESTTSSIESMAIKHPSKPVFSEIQKSKKEAIKRSTDVEDKESKSSPQFVKLSETVNHSSDLLKNSKKSVKKYKIPRLSDRQLVDHTMPFESNDNISNNSDKYSSNTSKKQPTVKRRSDDHGSRLKHILQDMNNSAKKCTKKNQIKLKSSQSHEKKERNLHTSVTPQHSSETIATVNNSQSKNPLNTPMEVESSCTAVNDASYPQSNECKIIQMDSDSQVSTFVDPNCSEFATKNCSNNQIPIKSGDSSFPGSVSVEHENICNKSSQSSKKKQRTPHVSVTSQHPCEATTSSCTTIKTNSYPEPVDCAIIQMDSSPLPSDNFKSGEKLKFSSDSKVSTSLELNSYNCSEFSSKNCPNNQVPISAKSGAKCIGPPARSVNTENKNIYYYELIRKIVELEPEYLQNKGKNFPSFITKNLVKLPLSFDTYDKYVKSFLQIILLEIWETVCLTSEAYLKSKSEKRFYFAILSYQPVNGLLKLQCESIVNKDVSFIPHSKSLVILDLKESLESDKWQSTFGLVTNPEIESLQIEFMSTCQWKCLPQEWLHNAKVWKYSVYIKNQEISLAKNCLMEGNGICNLEDKVKLTEALNSLQFSPMAKSILSPDWKTFSVNGCDQLFDKNYQTIQREICYAVCEKMTGSAEKRKIILLEGPPGSGKTEAIAGVCHELTIKHSQNLKILVTAPSHFAVDNIANQMIELNQRLGSQELTFIRTGDPRFINHKYINYSLNEKLEKARKRYEHEFNKWEYEKSRIRDRISYYQKKSSEGRSYENEIAQLEMEEKKLPEVKWNELREKNAILNSVNIILSTFNDCYNLYLTKINFSCCIIDEANQATEPETLYPFMLKNNKFFIVGDTKQLPPSVKSDLAIQFGFQRSLLERFQMYFAAKHNKSPAIQLKLQFRMHGDISNFPFKTFYFKDYIPPQYSYAFINSPLKPYIVFDDISDLNTQESSSYDKSGCFVIANLCKCIVEHCPVSHKAVIVPSVPDPYISALVKNLPFPSIEVDKIDSFQGREKSICILSCYPASISHKSLIQSFSCEKRMNVALTRASHCLIICGPVHLLKVLPYWNALIEDSKARNCHISYTYGENITNIFEEKILK